MAVTSNIDKFVAATRKAQAAVPLAVDAGLRGAAYATKGAVMGAARSRAWKPTGSWVRYDLHGVPSHRLATVSLRTGRAYWAERGTKPHDEVPTRKAALRTPLGPRAAVRHPGATGRPFWHSGVRAAGPLVPRAVARAVRASMRATWGS